VLEYARAFCVADMFKSACRFAFTDINILVEKLRNIIPASIPYLTSFFCKPCKRAPNVNFIVDFQFDQQLRPIENFNPYKSIYGKTK
jgi:hypothetical protein